MDTASNGIQWFCSLDMNTFGKRCSKWLTESESCVWTAPLSTAAQSWFLAVEPFTMELVPEKVVWMNAICNLHSVSSETRKLFHATQIDCDRSTVWNHKFCPHWWSQKLSWVITQSQRNWLPSMLMVWFQDYPKNWTPSFAIQMEMAPLQRNIISSLVGPNAASHVSQCCIQSRFSHLD